MKIGYAFCGSFCTLGRAFDECAKLKKEGFDVQPILSENVFSLDSRFTVAKEFRARVEELCGHPVIHTVTEAEPLGPASPLDALVVAPCTGNTLAKVANGITDTAVTMAIKAHLREDRPTLIALASNDSLSQNLKNIATLLLRKRLFFVPMRQDDPMHKPHSLVADFERIPQALAASLKDKQLRPLFL